MLSCSMKASQRRSEALLWFCSSPATPTTWRSCYTTVHYHPTKPLLWRHGYPRMSPSASVIFSFFPPSSHTILLTVRVRLTINSCWFGLVYSSCRFLEWYFLLPFPCWVARGNGPMCHINTTRKQENVDYWLNISNHSDQKMKLITNYEHLSFAFILEKSLRRLIIVTPMLLLKTIFSFLNWINVLKLSPKLKILVFFLTGSFHNCAAGAAPFLFWFFVVENMRLISMNLALCRYRSCSGCSGPSSEGGLEAECRLGNHHHLHLLLLLQVTLTQA